MAYIDYAEGHIVFNILYLSVDEIFLKSTDLRYKRLDFILTIFQRAFVCGRHHYWDRLHLKDNVGAISLTFVPTLLHNNCQVLVSLGAKLIISLCCRTQLEKVDDSGLGLLPRLEIWTLRLLLVIPLCQEVHLVAARMLELRYFSQIKFSSLLVDCR